MKKFVVFIVCFVYALASSGATVNFHYCMGKLIGVDIVATSAGTCTNCGMHKDEKKGCCNDKHATFQVKKDQVASTINIVPANTFVYIQTSVSSLSNNFYSMDKVVVQLIHAPPLIQQISSYKLHCVFRI